MQLPVYIRLLTAACLPAAAVPAAITVLLALSTAYSGSLFTRLYAAVPHAGRVITH